MIISMFKSICCEAEVNFDKKATCDKCKNECATKLVSEKHSFSAYSDKKQVDDDNR